MKGYYFHTLFRRDEPSLCLRMKSKRSKNVEGSMPTPVTQSLPPLPSIHVEVGDDFIISKNNAIADSSDTVSCGESSFGLDSLSGSSDLITPLPISHQNTEFLMSHESDCHDDVVLGLVDQVAERNASVSNAKMQQCQLRPLKAAETSESFPISVMTRPAASLWEGLRFNSLPYAREEASLTPLDRMLDRMVQEHQQESSSGAEMNASSLDGRVESRIPQEHVTNIPLGCNLESGYVKNLGEYGPAFPRAPSDTKSFIKTEDNINERLALAIGSADIGDFTTSKEVPWPQRTCSGLGGIGGVSHTSTNEESRRGLEAASRPVAPVLPATLFPSKLYNMMLYVQEHALEDIVSWELDGHAIRVNKPKELAARLLPMFFKQTRYKSFQRQLNIYNFSRIARGPYKGCYFHPLFHQGQWSMLSGMGPVKGNLNKE